MEVHYVYRRKYGAHSVLLPLQQDAEQLRFGEKYAQRLAGDR